MFSFSGYPEIAATLEVYRYSFPFFSAFPLVIINFLKIIFVALFIFALSVLDLFDIFSAPRKRS